MDVWVNIIFTSLWLVVVSKEACDSGPVPIEDYIRQQGYPVEVHEITTADGYILTYHRIPYGKSLTSDNSVSRKPVLLQHGVMCSSAVWVISDDSLGYSLANEGFDLWLGNARGNTYSRKHRTYDPDLDKRAFWDFSWHEMGHYDLPAAIDYILNVTKQQELFYIGHSMGTTMFFVLGATRPEYMSKVQAAVLMAPVAYPWNTHNNMGGGIYQKTLEKVLRALGVYEIFPYSKHIYWLNKNICSRQLFQFLCRDFVFGMCGYDNKEVNKTLLPVFFNYIPAGASYKQFQHSIQISNKGAQFPQFNYGPRRNMWRYGSLTPPLYNMSHVRAPVYVYYAVNDWMAVPQDVFYTAQQLPNVQSVKKVPDDQFNHIDFMWAVDGKILVYDDIIATLHHLTKS